MLCIADVTLITKREQEELVIRGVTRSYQTLQEMKLQIIGLRIEKKKSKNIKEIKARKVTIKKVTEILSRKTIKKFGKNVMTQIVNRKSQHKKIDEGPV